MVLQGCSVQVSEVHTQMDISILLSNQDQIGYPSIMLDWEENARLSLVSSCTINTNFRVDRPLFLSDWFCTFCQLNSVLNDIRIISLQIIIGLGNYSIFFAETDESLFIMMQDIFPNSEIPTIRDPKVHIITFVRYKISFIISGIITIKFFFESNQSFQKFIRFQLHNFSFISFDNLWLKLINELP